MKFYKAEHLNTAINFYLIGTYKQPNKTAAHGSDEQLYLTIGDPIEVEKCKKFKALFMQELMKEAEIQEAKMQARADDYAFRVHFIYPYPSQIAIHSNYERHTANLTAALKQYRTLYGADYFDPMGCYRSCTISIMPLGLITVARQTVQNHEMLIGVDSVKKINFQNLDSIYHWVCVARDMPAWTLAPLFIEQFKKFIDFEKQPENANDARLVTLSYMLQTAPKLIPILFTGNWRTFMPVEEEAQIISSIKENNDSEIEAYFLGMVEPSLKEKMAQATSVSTLGHFCASTLFARKIVKDRLFDRFVQARDAKAPEDKNSFNDERLSALCALEGLIKNSDKGLPVDQFLLDLWIATFNNIQKTPGKYSSLEMRHYISEMPEEYVAAIKAVVK